MSQSNTFGRFLVDFDMFGHQIGVKYRGRGAYKTRVGACVTFVTYFFMLINLISLIEAFFDGSN